MVSAPTVIGIRACTLQLLLTLTGLAWRQVADIAVGLNSDTDSFGTMLPERHE
jgi:hypothetical protein